MKKDGSIGEYGTYSAEITADGKAKVMVGVEFDVIAELRKLAKSTENQLDDMLVDRVALALGRLPPKSDEAAATAEGPA